MAEQLSAMGYDASVIRAESTAVSEIKDALLVFVKKVKPATLELVKENKNIAIWDFIDTNKSQMPAGLGFDGVIFPTQRARLDFSCMFSPDVSSTVIWSHADPRWKPARPWRYRLAYLGSRAGLDDCYSDIKGLHFVYIRAASPGERLTSSSGRPTGILVISPCG
jgi:hypothetical protein